MTTANETQDLVNDLIAQFEQEDENLLRDEDHSLKLASIVALSKINDARVVPFFLKVATDPAAFDLARIAVFENLKHPRQINEETHRRIGAAIVETLNNDEDEDVLNYAAMAASPYLAVPGVAEVLLRIARDSEESRNLRHNAFGAFEEAGKNAQTIKAISEFRDDKEWGRAAQRILDRWDKL